MIKMMISGVLISFTILSADQNFLGGLLQFYFKVFSHFSGGGIENQWGSDFTSIPVKCCSKFHWGLLQFRSDVAVTFPTIKITFHTFAWDFHPFELFFSHRDDFCIDNSNFVF